jgi:sulfate transport system ATP-binding protein
VIRLEGLSKQVGATRILDDLSLHVAAGSFVALLGPSGSGKTTLLRVIAGLEHADSGTLHLAGQPAHALPPGGRGLGFVFQGYALFEHMTVARNIAFGLHVRRPRPPRRAIAATVERMLALVRLQGLGDRLPSQLSGGQRQRVALARTLAVEPRILLLDEPFGALDRQVREELRGELRRIHDALGTTTLFVTHDHEEAMALADRALMLDRGRLVAEHAGHGRPAPGAPLNQAAQHAPPQPLAPFRRIFET